jgi:hypothetical protein
MTNASKILNKTWKTIVGLNETDKWLHPKNFKKHLYDYDVAATEHAINYGFTRDSRSRRYETSSFSCYHTNLTTTFLLMSLFSLYWYVTSIIPASILNIRYNNCLGKHQSSTLLDVFWFHSWSSMLQNLPDVCIQLYHAIYPLFCCIKSLRMHATITYEDWTLANHEIFWDSYTYLIWDKDQSVHSVLQHFTFNVTFRVRHYVLSLLTNLM